MPNNVHKLRDIPVIENWSKAAPSPYEEQILTIVCGNSNYHWALHLGFQHKFVPSLFWNTPHSDADEIHYHKEDPCDLLMTHIASQAHTLIFGNSDNMGCIQKASEAAALRKSPILSIYLISNHPKSDDNLQPSLSSPPERKILYMFRHVPVRIFKLQNTDFYDTQSEGLYPTLGVDRVAVLYGAQRTYGNPILCIDGGTAMTYTALDRHGNIMGGGISPGVKVRFQSLHEQTGGALPLIDPMEFNEAVETVLKKNQQGFPFFAKDTKLAMITTVCSELAGQLRNIVKQFVSDVSKPNNVEETTAVPFTAIPSIINTKTVDVDRNFFYVLITGGDGELLQQLLKPDASHIIRVEPDSTPIPITVKVLHCKNFAHYGMAYLLHQKCMERPTNDDDPTEELRHKMIGLRVAIPSKTEKSGISRATVLSVDFDPPEMTEGKHSSSSSSSHNNNHNHMNTNHENHNTNNTSSLSLSISNYTFLIRHDTTAKQQMLPLKAFYDGLVLYDEVGEEEGRRKDTLRLVVNVEKDNEEEEENWSEQRRARSMLVQTRIVTLCPELELRHAELQPYILSRQLKDFFQCQTMEEREAKRRKMDHRVVTNNNNNNTTTSTSTTTTTTSTTSSTSTSTTPTSTTTTTTSTLLDSPKQYIGERVAKLFEVEDPKDPSKTIESIFFGTVEYISNEAKLWYFVQYDDGDSEECDLKDLKDGLKLYNLHKNDDDNWQDHQPNDDVRRMETEYDNVDHENVASKSKTDRGRGESAKTEGTTTPPRISATLINL